MAQSFDIQLLPIARKGGRNQATLSGLYVSPPQKRTARGRGNDQLILYMGFQGNPDLSPDPLDVVVQKMMRSYFTSSGSTSAALRAIAEDLNDFLVDYNRKGAANAVRLIGSLTQVVVRADNVYIAISGPVHSYIARGGACDHYYDLTLTGQGLGMGKATLVRFNQWHLQSSDVLLFSAQPSPGWDCNLFEELQGNDADHIRRGLLDGSETEISALLLNVTEGQGRILQLPLPVPPEAISGDASAVDSKPDDVESATISEGDMSSPESIVPAAPHQVEQKPVPPQLEEAPRPQPALPPEQPLVQKTVLEPEKSSVPPSSAFLPGLVKVGEAFNDFFQVIGRGFGKFFGRLFPEELLEISNSTMAVIAILVPMIVVAAGSGVYYQLGRADQGRRLYRQAGEAAVNALEMQEPLSQRAEFLVALDYLQQAEQYGGIPPAKIDELRSRVYREIDVLDLVHRVDYKPALEPPLSEGVRITRMLASFNDLYILDGASGKVMRAIKTPFGYDLDDEFRCSAEYSSIPMNPLVDMVLWQGFMPEANIMAVDSIGNVLFCHPGRDPLYDTLTPPAVGSFQNIKALASDRGTLYVLDPPANAVWVYAMGKLDEVPSFFFGEVPPPIQDAVDLAANFDELYVLHTDGRLTLCFAFSQGVSLPKCNDPQPYTDFREGRANMPYIPARPFSQLYANPAPDPSLYILEPVNHSVTHFSYRNLGFQREYSSLYPLEGGDASAFTVSGVERLVFIALGNDIYFGVMP